MKLHYGTNNGVKCWILDLGNDNHGKRIRRCFQSEAKARQALEDYQAGVDIADQTIADLRPGERMALAEILGEIWGKGMTLSQVWADWQEWSGNQATRNCPDHWTALDHLISTLEDAGRSPRYLRDLKAYLRQFLADHQETNLGGITHDNIRAWLRARGESGATRSSNLGRIGSMFRHAIREGWVARNPLDRLQRETVTAGPPKILTVDQARELCRAVLEIDPELAPWLGLSLFAGLRPDEVAQIRREAVLESGEVVVEGVTSKVRQRRVVTLHPTALAWVSLPGTLPFVNLRRRRQAVGARAGLTPWPQDVLRHTAATHLLAYHGTPEKTAMELGNSPRILQRHYRGLATKADSEAFWGLGPEGVKKDKIIVDTRNEVRHSQRMTATSTKSQFTVGSNVLVTEEGMEATVVLIENDGDLYVRFEDGDEGSYSPNEVEAL